MRHPLISVPSQLRRGCRAAIPTLILALLYSCGQPASTRRSGESAYTPAYAKGFSIEKAAGRSSIITVTDPWQTASGVRMEIFVSRDGATPPEGFDGTVIEAPVKRAVCMSSTYIALIDALGSVDVVKGVSGARYITNPAIRSAYASGSVMDVGADANLNYELLASLKPDLMMIYGVAGESSVHGTKIKEMDIPVAYVGDYLESHPLGKAEWLVFMGELLDKREEAEELFSRICDNYFRAAALVSDVRRKPVVVLNAPYRDTWFMPGRGSYMARLIEDAGGRPAFREPSRQSSPVSGEAAFVMAMEADYWLNPNQASSIAELILENPRLSNIPAVTNSRVYNNTLRSTPDGGSDFWESGAVRPDIVLRDLASILHPELLPDHELYYYRRLE